MKRQAARPRRRRPPLDRPERSSSGFVPFTKLLASKDALFACGFLCEPNLLFGNHARWEDPKTGLMDSGPYSKTDATRRESIRVGVVGPSDAIDRALRLIEQMRLRIPPNERLDAMLHPGFPGMNEGDPFQVQLVSQPIWQRPLRVPDIAAIENHPDFTVRVGMLREVVKREVVALKKLDGPPDVVLVAMTQKLEELCRVGIADHDAEERELDDDAETPEDIVEDAGVAEDEGDHANPARNFRRALKADSLDVLPTQLLWHRTLAGTRGVQDLATRTWNLSVALLYKAGVIPWRLSDVMAGSCFVGVSFFRPDEADSSTLRTSVAQAFTDRGEGFVLQGDSFDWDQKKENEKSPHLKREDAHRLLQRVLRVYKDQTGIVPARVTLHKSSRFTLEEREGFESALSDVPHHALVTLGRRGIVCLRPGTKATLRGTLVDFGEKRGLIYTAGYIPFYRCYPGLRIPQPLEVLENWGSLTLQEVAEDIMRLTKLNWNTAAFCCSDPITLAFAKRVGDILKVANTKDPALHYRYYM